MRKLVSAGKLLRQIEIEYRDTRYKNKGRYIEPAIWNEIKALKNCEKCNAKLDKPPYIHHKKPVSEQGSNERENLLGVCFVCHEELDKKLNLKSNIKPDWRTPQYINNIPPYREHHKPNYYCDKCQKKFRNQQAKSQHNHDVHGTQL